MLNLSIFARQPDNVVRNFKEIQFKYYGQSILKMSNFEPIIEVQEPGQITDRARPRRRKIF